MVKSEIIQSIVAKLKTGYKPEKVILFGSHAWGTPDAESDLDLLIIKKTTRPRRKRAPMVRRILREENMHIAMDILVMTPAEVDSRITDGDTFLARICNQGKVLLG
jgi:uncharacterized protein